MEQQRYYWKLECERIDFLIKEKRKKKGKLTILRLVYRVMRAI